MTKTPHDANCRTISARELALSMELERLTTELRAFRTLMDERDKRYDVVDRSNKDAVSTALLAVEKAAEKLEAANKEYKTSSNEWRGTLNDIVARMLTRDEVERRFGEQQSQINDLRLSRSNQEGKSAQTIFLFGAAVVAAQVITSVIFHFVK